MVILGLDVGSTMIGIALLEVPPGAVSAVARERAKLLAHAKLDIDATLAMLASLQGRVDLVAIEPPGGVHPGLLRQRGAAAAMGVSKYASLGAKLAGRLMGHAEALGMRVVEIPATEWRRGLLGKANASNAAIAKALGYRIVLPAVTNADERDAAGCALWGAQREATSGWKR